MNRCWLSFVPGRQCTEPSESICSCKKMLSRSSEHVTSITQLFFFLFFFFFPLSRKVFMVSGVFLPFFLLLLSDESPVTSQFFPWFLWLFRWFQWFSILNIELWISLIEIIHWIESIRLSLVVGSRLILL